MEKITSFTVDHIRLQPENDTMEPIIVDDCQILGKVFGVFRLYH